MSHSESLPTPIVSPTITNKYRLIECDHDILPECFNYLELNEILRCTVVSHDWNQIIQTHPKRTLAYATYYIKQEISIQLPIKYRPCIRHLYLDLPKKDSSEISFEEIDQPADVVVVSLREFTRATSIKVKGRGRHMIELPTLFELLLDHTGDGRVRTPVNDSTADSSTVDLLPSSDQPVATTSTTPILSLHLFEPAGDFVAGILLHPRLRLLEELTLSDSLSLEDVTAIGTLVHLKKFVCTQPVDSHFFHVIHNLLSLTTLRIESLPIDMGPPKLPSQLIHLTIESAVAPFDPLSSLTQLQVFECSLKVRNDATTISKLITMVAWLSQLTTLLSIDLKFVKSPPPLLPSIEVLNLLTPLVCHNNNQLVTSDMNIGDGGQWCCTQKICFRRPKADGQPKRTVHHTDVSSISLSATNSTNSTSFPSLRSMVNLLYSWRPTLISHLALSHHPLSLELVHSLEAQAFVWLQTFSFTIGNPPLVPTTRTIIQFYRFLGRQTSLEKLTLNFTHLNSKHPHSFLMSALCQYALPHLVKLKQLTLYPIKRVTGDYHRWGPYFIETAILHLPRLNQLNVFDKLNSWDFLHDEEIAVLRDAGIKFRQSLKK